MNLIAFISRVVRPVAPCAILMAALSAAPASRAQPAAPDAFAQCRQIGRGVNIIGYDPLWKSRDQARFQAKHFRLLKEAGFNSVRINLHPFRAMDRANGFALRGPWLETLDWAVQNATNAGLVAILDLHEFHAMAEDPDGNHDRFLAFWRQVSARFQDASDRVMFEILNEPFGKLTPVLWNRFANEALAAIREKNPTRTVIVGPAFWNGINYLNKLELPGTDRNLIVTVHYYSPMEFTHQGASWSSHKDKTGVRWTGTEAERKAVRDDFDRAAAWAKEHNRPIFLGEFGAYDKGPMADRARYTDAVARTAESLGWSWAYWQFDSDFILYDISRDAWVVPIRDALVPPPR